MVFCNRIDEADRKGEDGHNPYFNRWFSAIKVNWYKGKNTDSHNPYFNRWFSAICM